MCCQDVQNLKDHLQLYRLFAPCWNKMYMCEEKAQENVMFLINKGAFYWYGLILILAWLSNHMPSNWITKLLINSQTSSAAPFTFAMDKKFHSMHYNWYNYLSVVGFRFRCFAKGDPGTTGSRASANTTMTPPKTHRNGPLARYVKLRVVHAPGLPGTFPRLRGLAIPTSITARASRTCRYAYQDR